MELLKTFGLDWRLLFWQVVNFAVVFFVLKRYAFGPIVAALSTRTARIEQGLKDAAAAKENLARTEQGRKDALAAARSDAGRIIAEARGQAETLKAELLAEAKAEVEALVARGQERLLVEKDAMINAARAEVGELVVAAVAKVLPRELSAKDHERLVADAAEVMDKTYARK